MVFAPIITNVAQGCNNEIAFIRYLLSVKTKRQLKAAFSILVDLIYKDIEPRIKTVEKKVSRRKYTTP
jgi:hypothetical protein